MSKLDSCVAVVTGGSSGIGRAASLALAAAGAHVAVVGRDPDRIDDTVTAIARRGLPRALGVALDVRREEDMDAMAARALREWGRIDILVASAGVGRTATGRRLPRPVADLAAEEWDELVDTNLKGVFLSNRAVLPAMIAQRSGTIVNVCSARGGQRGQPYASAYCASKFGVVGFSQAVAEEVRRKQVRVMVVSPDATETPLLSNTTLGNGRSRPLAPSEVADVIVYLATLPQGTVVPHAVISTGGPA